MILKERWVKIGLLLLLSAILTLILQEWVGRDSIYSEAYAEKRLLYHGMILNNNVPAGKTWSDYGAGGINIRVFTVYLVELLHRVSGFSIAKLYRVVDSVSMFLFFPLLFYFLSRWYSSVYCLIGILFFACASILTYYLYFFHPCDRLSLLCWLVLLILLLDNRLILFAFILAITMTVKYDVILLPALYWMYNVSQDNWKQVSTVTAILFLMTCGIFLALRTLLPGGFREMNPELRWWQITSNWKDIVALNVRYPPFLGFILPLILALYKPFARDRFIWSSAVFGIGLLIPFFLASNFQEIRAEMPVMILIMPSALFTLKLVLENEE